VLKKDEYLLREGEYCKNINYIKSGIFRNFYLKEGTEVITSFAFPSDISTILRSVLLNEPSREYIQAITDCEIFSISVENYLGLKTKYPVIEKMDAKITQLYALMLEERIFSLKFHTAAQRYQLLLLREAQIVKHVPLTYIASYLGITLETLSRIRTQKKIHF
jgi:CRP-like cAMP-binding protein